MECPKCKSTIKVKNGQAHGMQRYKCKECGCNYTKSTPRGKPEATKRMAIQMHLEGLGYRAIGRLLSVSNVTVLYWVRQVAQAIRSLKLWERSQTPPECIEIDEMWHYIQKKSILGVDCL